MSLQIVKDAIESAIKTVNKMELSGDYIRYDCATTTMLNNLELTEDGYEARFLNYDLKIGGPDDDDANDSELEYNLRKNIEAEVSKYNKDIVKSGEIWSEKGWFYIIFQLKTEKKLNDSLSKLKAKVTQAESDISEFNTKVADKIKNQSSKK